MEKKKIPVTLSMAAAIDSLVRMEVTETYIAKGKPKDPCNCPVALVLKDAGIWGVDLQVLGGVVTLYDAELDLEPLRSQGHIIVEHGNEPKMALTQDVVERIRRYDETGEMQPFTFELPKVGLLLAGVALEDRSTFREPVKREA